MSDVLQHGHRFRTFSVVDNFNREDVLDLYLFGNLDEVRQATADLIQLYNHERPHDELNDMTPIEYLNMA